MSLDGQIRALAKGLHESVIDLDALLQDRKAGTVEVDLSLRYTNLRSGYENDVVEWAIDKYGIDGEYSLKTTDGHEIGKVDLAEDIRYSSDEISYGTALRKLQELGGLKLDEESQQVLDCLEGRLSYTTIDAVGLLVGKKIEQEVDVMDAYLKEKGFEEGKFQIDGDEIIGEVPESFLREVNPLYAVAPSVFGKTEHRSDNIAIDVENGRASVKIFMRELFPFRETSPITDKEKARDVLTTLTSYVIG